MELDYLPEDRAEAVRARIRALPPLPKDALRRLGHVLAAARLERQRDAVRSAE